jgi:hypothetical protein
MQWEAAMRAVQRCFVAGLIVLLSAGAAAAQDVGDSLRDHIQLESGIALKVQVPLPEGDWSVIAKGVERSTVSNVRLFKFYLVQVVNRVLTRVTFIETNEEFPNHGWKPPTYCSRTDVFYQEPKDTRGFGGDRGYDCLTINHAQMTSGRRSSPAVRNAYAWVWAHTTGMPTTLIGATYDISDGKRFLRVTYYRNPEADGFAPPRDSSWRSSDWHKDRLPGDPKKLAYMNEVKRWALQWKPKVQEGFNGKLAVR